VCYPWKEWNHFLCVIPFLRIIIHKNNEMLYYYEMSKPRITGKESGWGSTQNGGWSGWKY